MEGRRIKVLLLRCWPLLAVLIQQFFQACLAQSNPCEGFDDTRSVSYGTNFHFECTPMNDVTQSETFIWSQNGIELTVQEGENLEFNDQILDVTFVDSKREGNYTCTYQEDMNDDSRVDGTSEPMCIIVRGVPLFEVCQNMSEPCSRTNPPILFDAGHELEILAPVVYVGAGAYGAMFIVTGFSLLRPDLYKGSIISCTTVQPDGSGSEFNCNVEQGNFTGRIRGDFETDHKSYVNTSFVINSTRVNDTGEYIVRVTARDTTTVTVIMTSSTQTSTSVTRTTLTMTISASAVIPTYIPTSSVKNTGLLVPSTSTALTLSASPGQIVPTSAIVGTTVSPVASVSPVTDRQKETVIISVTIVAGIIILALLAGIVVVCLLILHGMCPKLKKQLMENVRLLQMKQNGRDDITIITEGTIMQNAKQYYQPESNFELTPEKNSNSSNI